MEIEFVQRDKGLYKIRVSYLDENYYIEEKYSRSLDAVYVSLLDEYGNQVDNIDLSKRLLALHQVISEIY